MAEADGGGGAGEEGEEERPCGECGGGGVRGCDGAEDRGGDLAETEEDGDGDDKACLLYTVEAAGAPTGLNSMGKARVAKQTLAR